MIDATNTAAIGAARPLPREAAVADFVALLKPRVMSLVVFTGIAGLVAAPAAMHPLLAAIAVLCIAVGAGASGAINMWYEADIDAAMARTRERPIPAGAVGEAHEQPWRRGRRGERGILDHDLGERQVQGPCAHEVLPESVAPRPAPLAARLASSRG